MNDKRNDGLSNVLHRYSHQHIAHDDTFVPIPQVLTEYYESDGLFAKIIDAPAEEALRSGFSLGLNNAAADTFVENALECLDWAEKSTTAIKWARLYGGCLIVMLIDDGGGLESPVKANKIKSVDELLLFESAVVNPDLESAYTTRPRSGLATGLPEFYDISTARGSFRVHASRCLVFRNGILPEHSPRSTAQFWGVPEYIRLKSALANTQKSHDLSVRLLERSVQPIYSMKGLASLLTTESGENSVLKRLETIDLARGIMNSIAIDSDGESYDFKSFSFQGASDVVDSSCNLLSALSNIPQTILFGRSPAGMNATGQSDLENYYNFVERIQRQMLKYNLTKLLDVVFAAGVSSGQLEEVPAYRVKFNPLWSLSETEAATVAQQRAQTSLIKAQTSQVYVDLQALDPSEVRRGLAADEEYTIEELLDSDDDDLFLDDLDDDTTT